MSWKKKVDEFEGSVKKKFLKLTHRIAGLEHKIPEKIQGVSFNPNLGFENDFVAPVLDIASKKMSETSAIVFEQKSDIDKKSFSQLLPTRVDTFDELLSDRGLERGSTILVSGGAGTGKTTFSLQSLYHGALNGEKGIYLSFEEQPEKIRLHMKKNYDMDFEPLEKKGLIAIIKVDPAVIARSLEETLMEKQGELKISLKKIRFPFVPDRICVDSLSALSIAFEKEEVYRKYLRELFESLESTKAVSFVLTETEQNPTVYSRTGVEEFLADGVMVLYNLKKKTKRENALEILKLRSGKHKKGLVSYRFGSKGIEIFI